ncbi:MAG: NAD(P)H-dependent oxidoreductase subunit E [Armatimonadetes bacterium]|nr:NAD(P)H-dependent oxidoreductase subunit E [Armatimonadota bacterium]
MSHEHSQQAEAQSHGGAQQTLLAGQPQEHPGPRVDLSPLKATLEKFPRRADQLLPLLRAVQELYGYLPREALDAVASHLKISRANVLGVATFYHHFSLVPQGRHKVCICRGTACHVRGSKDVLDSVCQSLGIEPGQTTPDLSFTVEEVMCLGACALAPLMVVDGAYYGKMDQRRALEILKQYKQEPQA